MRLTRKIKAGFLAEKAKRASNLEFFIKYFGLDTYKLLGFSDKKPKKIKKIKKIPKKPLFFGKKK
jgi:hypothetical protein